MRINNEPVYDCPICLDYGLVTVWHPAIAHFFAHHFADQLPTRWREDEQFLEATVSARYKAPYQKFPAPLPTEATAVVCQCRHGGRYRDQRRGEQRVFHVYDESRFCRYTGDGQELRQWVLAWSESHWQQSQWQPEAF